MSKSKWFSWQDLLDRWKVLDFELIELFKEGLEPYERPGKQRIYCPYDHHEHKHKSDRYDEILQIIKHLKRLICREKELEAGTFIYLEHFDPIVDYLETIGGRDFQLKNGSTCISPWEMDIVKTLRTEYTEEEATVYKEMDAIVVDDSNLNDDQKHLSWKYFVVPPSHEEIKKLISELELEETIFQRDNVLELEKRFGLGQIKMGQQSHVAQGTPPEKKLRPNQKAKIECRRIAKELWKEDRSMTIVDVEHELVSRIIIYWTNIVDRDTLSSQI